MQTFISHNIRDKEVAREIAIFLAAAPQTRRSTEREFHL